MKLLVVLSAILLGANALNKEFIAKMMKEAEAVGHRCAEENNASPEDMAELMKYNFPPTTHEAKCVIACFYKHYKMMKDDGTFDKEATIKAFDEVKKLDPELHGKIMKIIDVCEAKDHSSDDKCESASSMAGCVKTEADGLGITREAFLAEEQQ